MSEKWYNVWVEDAWFIHTKYYHVEHVSLCHQISHECLLCVAHFGKINLFPGALPQFPKSKLLNSIHLTGNNFSGELPRSWGGLVELEHLSLSRNSLTGSMPKEFGNLERLGWLFLSQNQLSGNIPKEISGLKSLRCWDRFRTCFLYP